MLIFVCHCSFFMKAHACDFEKCVTSFGGGSVVRTGILVSRVDNKCPFLCILICYLKVCKG